MNINKLQSFEERRDSIRADRIITVNHRLTKGNRQNPWRVSVTQNMSLSGLLFISSSAYHKGDLVEIQVVMSGILDIFKGYGEVVRSVQKRPGYYLVAVKYVDFKPPVKNRSAKKLV